MPGLVKQGLDKLYNQQRKDGGWGWWADSQESNVHLTAYVVFALIKAQQSGFEVQSDVLQRGQQFLVGKLVAARDLTSSGAANQQAFVLYVLAEGKPSPNNQISTERPVRQSRQAEPLWPGVPGAGACGWAIRATRASPRCFPT